MTTDQLIVTLAQSAGPVRPLPSTPARFGRWALGALIVTTASVLIIGARPGVSGLMRETAFSSLALVTLLTALSAAACALILSIPGAERTAVQRALPFTALAAWVAALVALMRVQGDVLPRLLALPVHPLCIIEIAGLALVPGWSLFTMLRRAAPLERGWTAALATLAAVAVGAAGTQFLCPIDDPAHQLVGHLLPAAMFTFVGLFAFRQTLDRTSRSLR